MNIYFTIRKEHYSDNKNPIVLSVCHHKKAKYYTTRVRVFSEDFVGGDEIAKGLKRSDKSYLMSLMTKAYAYVSAVDNSQGLSNIEPSDVVKFLKEGGSDPEGYLSKKDIKAENLFMSRLRRYSGTLNESTQKIYKRTEDALLRFNHDIESLKFEDINVSWLKDFESYLSKHENKVNTISIHLRNIRAVFNSAIDDEITTNYPFRKYKIKQESTEEQPISLKHLREIWSAEVEPWQREWIDLTKVVFFLIGINMADLAEIKSVNNGRVTYVRKKTGRRYSIKVEPELAEILSRWKGETHLLQCFDRNKDYRRCSVRMCHAVKCIGLPPASKGGSGKKAKINHHSKAKVTSNSKYGYFSLYSLRRGWASIAFNECGIPMDVISMALGHSDGMGLSVTQRYVRPDNKLVDDANRKVMDFVLYGDTKKGDS